jgi:hypothetical protein
MDLAQMTVLKSIGVSIPMVAFLMNTNAPRKEARRCKKYFYHLIFCRQLSDDALDWHEDMKRGQRTLVTQWLEETVGKDKPLREYRTAFETTVSPRVAQNILGHSKRSIRCARKMTCFTSTEFLEELPRLYKEMATDILRNYAV